MEDLNCADVRILSAVDPREKVFGFQEEFLEFNTKIEFEVTLRLFLFSCPGLLGRPLLKVGEADRSASEWKLLF